MKYPEDGSEMKDRETLKTMDTAGQVRAIYSQEWRIGYAIGILEGIRMKTDDQEIIGSINDALQVLLNK